MGTSATRRHRSHKFVGPLLCALVLAVPAALAEASPGPVAPAKAATPAPPPGCDPNYVGACVPQGAPQVTCQSLAPATDLLVVGEDVYGLDEGGAGRVACEASGADVVQVSTAPPPAEAPAAPAPDAAVVAPDAAVAAPAAPDAAVAGATAEAPAELARTGRTTMPLLALSLVLLTIGGALIMVTRPEPEAVWYESRREGRVRFSVESVER